MLLHGSLKTGFIHVQVLFLGNVPGQFKGQAVGGIKLERFFAIQYLTAGFFEFIEQFIQVAITFFNRTRKTFFFSGQVI
ncbi:MAG: hypothetical protein ACD_34C00312G0001 [uncultured bacterium]|nr:MAG: hypothetical protein ACD_34C00312G0001 [uncultured bacterium]